MCWIKEKVRNGLGLLALLAETVRTISHAGESMNGRCAAGAKGHCLVTAITTGLLIGVAGSAEAANPFKELAGSWRGAGQLVLADGKRERISCRGYYTSKSGEALTLAIRCASPSYRIEMRGNLTDSAGRVAGNWEERTFNAAGSVSGSASATRLNLAFGGSISGSMSIAVSGTSHRVNISTGGVGFNGVTISLSRG